MVTLNPNHYSQAFYEEFFEDAPDMFASVDAKTAEINACNRTLCTTLGYPREQVIGRKIHTVYHPDCHDEVARVFQDFVTTGVAESNQLTLVKADGTTMLVSLRVTARRNEVGEIVESRSIWRDITLAEKVKALELELRLQDAQKMESLALLAGGVAHDFNNLLATILGNANLCALDIPKEAPASEKITAIEVAAQRAADLTKQLLAYSGSQNHEQQFFDLSKVVEEMGHLLEVAISRKVVLNFDLAHEPINALGDVTQLRQVVMNLLTNGSDAIGDLSGMITVRTGIQRATKDYLASTMLGAELDEGFYGFLEISDTGSGISAENKAKMFDPFYTTKSRGHGLGLAAVLGIINSHKGTLTVYSEPGNGTTIKILLPLVAYEDTINRDKDPTIRGSGELVLLVDDDEHIRSMARQMLEHFNFRVEECSDGREALQYFQQHHRQIDIVLMDITMPHMDGITAFKAMRDIDAATDILLMSGHSQQHATTSLVGRSFAGFIQKPFSLGGLITAINSTLEQKKQR